MEDDQLGNEGGYTKPRDLRSATHRLKAEALRRYQLAHTEDEAANQDEVEGEGPDQEGETQGEQERPVEQQEAENMEGDNGETAGDNTANAGENGEPAKQDGGNEQQVPGESGKEQESQEGGIDKDTAGGEGVAQEETVRESVEEQQKEMTDQSGKNGQKESQNEEDGKNETPEENGNNETKETQQIGEDGQKDTAAVDGQNDTAAVDGQNDTATVDGQNDKAAVDGQNDKAAVDGQNDTAAVDGQNDTAEPVGEGAQEDETAVDAEEKTKDTEETQEAENPQNADEKPSDEEGKTQERPGGDDKEDAEGEKPTEEEGKDAEEAKKTYAGKDEEQKEEGQEDKTSDEGQEKSATDKPVEQDVGSSGDGANVNNNADDGAPENVEETSNTNNNNETDGGDDNEPPTEEEDGNQQNASTENTEEGAVYEQAGDQEPAAAEDDTGPAAEGVQDGTADANKAESNEVSGEETKKDGEETKEPDGGQEKTETTSPEAAAEGGKTPAPGDGSKVEESAAEGDTQEGEGEEGIQKDEEDENKIPTDFFYNYEEHASKAKIAEESGLPDDMITLYHSFGYDCKKMANLHMIDKNTVIFAAGNVVQLLDLQTKEQRYIRSTSGGGIGAITVHPSMKYFAVAEKGTMPNINVYEFPSLKLYRILREGTEKAYSFVDFNPAGNLLASVGSAPDYMLTLWDWMQEKIMLRSKAFSQDVFRVTFSPDNEGQLTTSGTGHIRFWKMASTFTGLKLQGQLGKFGRTEISDIHGYVELPDGKVLSGTEWGNMLLWDGGLIKVQISRKNKKPCHVGNIEQFMMDEGELITIGEDGFVRVWDFEKIDTADSTDESGVFEMDCMNELKVGNHVHLMSMVKDVDPEAENIWYAQDSNGAIWRLDLSFSHTTKAPERMVSYHAGQITAIDVSPVSQLVASTAIDNSVCVYDYASKTPLCSSSFNSGATSVLWLPQIVDPKGSTILAGFEDGVVRALTIARKDPQDAHHHHHRKDTHHPTASLLLKQAFKPHTKRTTAMALDSKGELLATGGADGTVFFLSVDETFKPIGFIEVPGPVSHMTWSPGYFDKNTLLVLCENGEVIEIEAPESGNYDTSKTFKITGLPTRQTTFRSIKSRLRREEEEARKAAEEEEKRKEKERQRRMRRERGLEDEEEEEEEEQEEVEPEPLYIPDQPSPILCGLYCPEDPNKFWVSMGDFDAGYLYECKFHDETAQVTMIKEGREEAIGEPVRAVPVLESDDIPIRTMHFGAHGHQVVLGMENGMIRIQTLDDQDGKRKHIPSSSQADFSTFGPFWMLNVHDNDYGQITGVKMSEDDQYLFTSGSDGNIFVFEMMSHEKVEESKAVARAKIPSAKKEDEGRKVSDIESQDHYSIELEKQKAEYDKMMKLADERKMEVRRTIAKLRRQFKKLLEKNQELPSHLQLQRKEFEMDPGIRRELERQTAEKIEMVHRELAWEAEKHRIGLEKLKERFKVELECERIVVVSIKTSHQVATYRTTHMTDEFVQLKREIMRRATLLSERGLSRDHTRDTLTGQSKRSETLSDTLLTPGAKDIPKKNTVLTGRLGEKVAKQLQKAEKIKQRRLVRQAEWDSLNASKPPEDYEDPADVTAIKEAQENMGDFKLKTAKDYVVPEHLRMNALKKRNQLLTLEELIHQHKTAFNNKVIALRNKKVHLIDTIKKHLEELANIQTKLTKDQCKKLPECPKLQSCETPEKKLEYTKESLLKFRKEMDQKAINEKTGGDGGGMFGGFGGGGGGETAEQKPGAAADKATPSSQRVLSSMSLRTPIPSMMDAAAAGRELTPLEQQLRTMEEIRLIYRQEELIQGIFDLIMEFDAELRMLRHDKFKFDVDLKNADLRCVTLFEELKLLKDFEKREDVFAEKVDAKVKEKNDMQQKVSDCQQKLDGKRKDIERLQEKEKALYATFQASLGENNKFAEFLNKVFKKKIKRAKKKETTGDGSDDESEESSDDESDWDSEEEDSDEDGLDDSVCPPGCDQELFDNTCALREKRLDFEEAMAEEKKTAEGLKKEVDALTKKQKIIESNLKTAEADLEAFQLEKQQKLNELDVVVTLNLNQVEHVVSGQMPQDISACLVFNNAGMFKLQKRIRELKEEKSAQRRHYKQHRQQHVQLIKDRKLMENRIEELQEKCNEMMRLKFGRIVDLEKLESVGVNRTVEELKERLRINEGENIEELLKWEAKISNTKGHITELTQENTERLRQLTLLVGENKTLEKALDTRQTSLGGEFQGVRKADVEERQRLIQLVQLQAQEVEALKEEISLLSRKGGHILPPTQPPIPQGSPTVRPPMSGTT